MSDIENENMVFEIEDEPKQNKREEEVETEESEVSSEEEREQTPPPPPEPKEVVQRTKTGRIKKKASPRTKERLRKQLAAGRAKSLEIRRRNKKLKEIEKRKKLDDEDKRLLEELQDRKTNQELRDEIKRLKESMANGSKEPLAKPKVDIPPEPTKKKSVAVTKQEMPPAVQRRIKSHLPGSMLFFKPK